MSKREDRDRPEQDSVHRLIQTDTKTEKSQLVGAKAPRGGSRGPLLGLGASVAVVGLLVGGYFVLFQTPEAPPREAAEQVASADVEGETTSPAQEASSDAASAGNEAGQTEQAVDSAESDEPDDARAADATEPSDDARTADGTEPSDDAPAADAAEPPEDDAEAGTDAGDAGEVAEAQDTIEPEETAGQEADAETAQLADVPEASGEANEATPPPTEDPEDVSGGPAEDVAMEGLPAASGPERAQESPPEVESDEESDGEEGEPSTVAARTGPREATGLGQDAGAQGPAAPQETADAAQARPPIEGPEAREEEVARRILDVFHRSLQIPDDRRQAADPAPSVGELEEETEPVPPAELDLPDGSEPETGAEEVSSSAPVPERAPDAGEPEDRAEEDAQGEAPEDVLTDMVRVPTQTVRFGAGAGDTSAQANEQPAVSVDVSPFMLERHEVTNRQYKEFLDATGYEPVPTSDSDDVTRYNWDPETRSYPDGLGDYPVVNVSRADAEAYAEWAGRRLPTEVEWEAAARFSAGNAPYPWGSSFADRVFANFDAGSLVPVEQYQANELGLYDLAGNAFEWVVDAYVPDIHDTFDPESYPPTQGEEGVLKGGAYYSTFREIRISYRENNFPEVRFFGYGFRLAADAEEQ